MLQRSLPIRQLFSFILVGIMGLLVACGQVMTPPSTQVSPAVPTPTASAGRPVREATGTPLPLPPPETATPTVTPTPVVHVVERGDTLQAIAFEYGVGLDALQRVNGIENPQFLQVGQELVIPLGQESEETIDSMLLPTPTPQPVQVQGAGFYRTPVGSMWCLGEVANTTDVSLTNVHVKLTLFDSDGKPLAEDDAFVTADLISPGGSSPFGILFMTAPDWASYQLTIVRADAAGDLSDGYIPLSVAGVKGRLIDSQLEVTGIAKHDGTGQDAESVDIIVTTYDAEGAVTGFRQHTIKPEEGLAPGATIPFTVLLTPHGGSPDDFRIIAVGRVPGM